MNNAQVIKKLKPCKPKQEVKIDWYKNKKVAEALLKQNKRMFLEETFQQERDGKKVNLPPVGLLPPLF